MKISIKLDSTSTSSYCDKQGCEKCFVDPNIYTTAFIYTTNHCADQKLHPNFIDHHHFIDQNHNCTDQIIESQFKNHQPAKLEQKNSNDFKINLFTNPLSEEEFETNTTNNTERTTSVILNLPESNCCCKWLCCQTVFPDYLNNILVKIKSLLDHCNRTDLDLKQSAFVSFIRS